MSCEAFRLDAPAFWPAPRFVLGSREEPDSAAPWLREGVTTDVNIIFGVTYDLDDRGINWLAGFLGKPDFRCRLILLVYPACATREEHLLHMCRWKIDHGDRFETRVLPVRGPALTVLSHIGRTGNMMMAVGAVSNLGLEAASPRAMSFLFHPDRLLHDEWRRWFDELWNVSAPLTDASTAIPALVPAEGSAKAARLWNDYLRKCYALIIEGIENAGSSPDASGYAAFATNTETPEQGQPVQRSVTMELGVPRLDPLAERIAALYRKGLLVSIDKHSRLPPLEVPIKPEWFGLASFRQIGSASRRLSFKASAFEENERRKVDQIKDATRGLLQRFSFSLADSQWWIPRSAKALFEEQLKRANSDAVKYLGNVVGPDIGRFLRSREQKILRDVEDMYNEFFPGRPLPRSAAEQILAALYDRLNRIGDERVLPLVTYSEVHFVPEQEQDSEWATAWPQALRLLSGIVELPRRAATDPFFFRGLNAEKAEFVKAMNVLNDAFVEKWLKEGSSSPKLEQWARSELNLVQEIVNYEQATPRAKCRALLALTDGLPSAGVWNELKNG